MGTTRTRPRTLRLRTTPQRCCTSIASITEALLVLMCRTQALPTRAQVRGRWRLRPVHVSRGLEERGGGGSDLRRVQGRRVRGESTGVSSVVSCLQVMLGVPEADLAIRTGRRDKAGLPVYVFSVRALTKDAINKYTHGQTEERLSTRMIALYEHMVQFALPFCSDVPHPHQETPVSATTTSAFSPFSLSRGTECTRLTSRRYLWRIIVALLGAAVAHAASVDVGFAPLCRCVARASKLQRTSLIALFNSQETLGTIYIIGAPNFFSVVWGWIGKWCALFLLPSHSQLSSFFPGSTPEPSKKSSSSPMTKSSLPSPASSPPRTFRRRSVALSTGPTDRKSNV